MPQPARKPRRWLGPAIKLAIVALLVWGVHRTLGEAFEKLRQHPLQLSPGWLVLSGVLYLLGMLPAALFWHRLLRVLGQKASWGRAVRAYFVGHIGKYVPGKALVVVLRAGMVRGEGVSVAVAAVTVFVETLTMMASGSAIAAALIAVLFRGQWQYAVVALGFMLAAELPTLPPVFKRIIRLTKIGRLNPDAVAQLDRIDYGTLLLGWLATGIGWFVMGLSLIAALRGIGRDEPGWIEGLPLGTMVVAVSIVAGFMSFIPGGLVVRDIVMARLIEPRLGAEAAVASAIVLRIVWLLAELTISALLHLWRPRRTATQNRNTAAIHPRKGAAEYQKLAMRLGPDLSHLHEAPIAAIRAKRTVPQSSKSASNAEALFVQAIATMNGFADVLGGGFAESLGARVFGPGSDFETAKATISANLDKGFVLLASLKSRERAAEKVRDKYNGDWSQSTDIVRGTVLVPSYEDFAEVVRVVRREGEKVGWRIAALNESFGRPSDFGYRDVKLTLTSPNGHQTELQLNTTNMWVAKEVMGGHQLYDQWRKIAEPIKREGRPATPQERERLTQLRLKSLELYGEYWEKSQRMAPLFPRHS